ncbi:MAG TPA: alpha-ketoglutarate-dependent dioxygenase AlkB [Polyangiaceae bacterium]|jgi:alkylated DNA repair dioxygenase AlkB|nr:alpha-ketoglutarate-dependent dioxygenase AlkB [Polyangiaceae bacterium]
MLLGPGQTLLELGGLVRYEPGWLARADADALLQDLRSGVDWKQGVITMFGRELPEPRLTAWFGEADYTYSGRTLRAAPWPDSLAALRARVEGASGARFNAALLNLYRDGRDSMGLHSDDEPELGPNPTIASVSLGAERRFVLVPKKKAARQKTLEVPLGHGSLVVMAGACQHNYRHGVPRQPGSAGERINLTFRKVTGR